METSRFPEISEVDLDKMKEGNQTKTLSKARQHGSMFLTTGEERVLEDIFVEELDAVLCKLYAEVRRKDGKEYEPYSLAVMQASLARHLII